MVDSMKLTYKKVILIPFSIGPVLRFQCVFLVFGRRSAYKNSHPYPVQIIFPRGYTHNMQIRKTEQSQMAACSRRVYNTGHGSLFYRYCNNPNPILMLTLGLSTTLRQLFRPKYYTTTIFRLKVSISKCLGYSSIGKTMTRDLRFRPASLFAVTYW